MHKLVKEITKVIGTPTFYYIMLLASLFQLYKIYLDRSMYCGAMFLLSAAIACQFTKKAGICLLAGLIVTNFVVGCSKII